MGRILYIKLNKVESLGRNKIKYNNVESSSFLKYYKSKYYESS